MPALSNSEIEPDPASSARLEPKAPKASQTLQLLQPVSAHKRPSVTAGGKEGNVFTAEQAEIYIRRSEDLYRENQAGNLKCATFAANATLYNPDGSKFTTDAKGRISSFTLAPLPEDRGAKRSFQCITYDADDIVIYFKDPYNISHRRLTADKSGPWLTTDENTHPQFTYTDKTHDDVTFTEIGCQLWNHRSNEMLATTGDGRRLLISRMFNDRNVDMGFKTTFYPQTDSRLGDRRVIHFNPTIGGVSRSAPVLVVERYDLRKSFTVMNGNVTSVTNWPKPRKELPVFDIS